MKNRIIAWLNSNSNDEEKAKEIEAVSEQFAIDFTNWVEDNYFPDGVVGLWHKTFRDSKEFTTDQLLEIFKKLK